MRRILIIFLSLAAIILPQSCSDDDLSDITITGKDIAIRTHNTTLTKVSIKSGDKIIFETSNLDKGYYDQKISGYKRIYIEASGIVTSDDKAYINIGEVIGGDAFGTIHQIEKEDAKAGEKLSVSGTIIFEE